MMTDVHRSLLQSCANHGCLKETMALKILKDTLKKFGDNRESTTDILYQIIGEINHKQAFIDHEIKKFQHEMIPEPYLVFVSTLPNSTSQFHPKTELARNYFEMLIDEIICNENFCIGIMLAINISFDLKEKKLNKTLAKELMDEWTDTGYFLLVDDLLFLGPRAIAEMGAAIKIEYPDTVKSCPMCRSVIFYGIKCGNEDCEVIFHRRCILERLKQLNTCSECKEIWKTTVDDSNAIQPVTNDATQQK